MDRKLHVIHSRNGKIGADIGTSQAQVAAIVAALKADKRKHLILHFHGGLVSREQGLEAAQHLYPYYSPSENEGGYPIFFVWESGFADAIRNNLGDLAREPAFDRLKDKLLGYLLGKLGPHVFDKAFVADAAAVEAAEVLERVPKDALRGRAAAALPEVDDADIAAALEADAGLKAVLAGLPNASVDEVSDSDKSVPLPRHNWVTHALTEGFTGGVPAGPEKSQDNWVWNLMQVAWFLGKVARAVLLRMRDGRDHGLHATCIEELMRAMKLGGSTLNEWGKLLEWEQMKGDTEDAFAPDPACAGTALLRALAAALEDQQPKLELERITLVGHSAGAIYIRHWLEHSACLGNRKQDLVFLAPAITHADFAGLVKEHGKRIGHFRMFAMQDRHERRDQPWGQERRELGTAAQDWRRFVYPASLLYLVSGLLESSAGPGNIGADAPDTPILGMQRYLDEREVYPPAAFPDIETVRTWLALPGHRAVWSVTTDGEPGFQCDSIDHGEFDNDEQICATLRHIVTRKL